MQQNYGGPLAGPASAYPTLSRPASICFIEAKDVFVPGLIAGNFRLPDCAFAEIDKFKLGRSDCYSGGAEKVAALTVDVFERLDRVHGGGKPLFE